MRLFLIVDGNGAEMADVIEILKKESHEVVYWSGVATGVEKKFPDIIFHNHFDARKNILPQGFNILDFPPPDEDLINQLQESELLILPMISRDFRNMPISESRHLYYDMIRYWHGIMKKYKPDSIIFTVMPHHVYNYVIYALAKLLGIKTIIFEDSWVSDRALIYDNFWQGSRLLHQTIEKNKDKNFSINDLSKDLLEYYQAQRDRNTRITPIYMEYQKKQHTGLGLFSKRLKIINHNFKKGKIIKVVFQHLVKRLGANLRKEYMQLQVNPDLNKPFIYAPLNFQPERTTSPQGGVFVDQILLLEILSASLPKGWNIYIKEHPTQWWRNGMNYTNARYKGYYKKIAALKNVFLIPVAMNSHALINNSQAVATVTGTAGFEAMIFSKPVIIFGYPWYRDCPGLFKVKGVDSCRAAFKKIKEGYKVDQSKIINYLASFDQATIHCVIDDFDDEKLSSFTRQERINNFAKAVLNELN